MFKVITILCLFALAAYVESASKRTFAITEESVCKVKKSCQDCLRLSQCTWCSTENKCFSTNSPPSEDFCKDEAVSPQDFGLSINENAECACTGEQLESNCTPPGATDGVVCSGRGECRCGRCACAAVPDPEHPSKTVLGEYCEFDNFSCDGPHCNEGPYPLSPPDNDYGYPSDADM